MFAWLVTLKQKERQDGKPDMVDEQSGLSTFVCNKVSQEGGITKFSVPNMIMTIKILCITTTKDGSVGGHSASTLLESNSWQKKETTNARTIWSCLAVWFWIFSWHNTTSECAEHMPSGVKCNGKPIVFSHQSLSDQLVWLDIIMREDILGYEHYQEQRWDNTKGTLTCVTSKLLILSQSWTTYWSQDLSITLHTSAGWYRFEAEFALDRSHTNTERELGLDHHETG